MPTRAKKICQAIGCGELCDGRYCGKHVKKNETVVTRQIFDQKRGSAHWRGYNRNHRRLREMVLARDPFCQIKTKCDGTALSTDADHIVPRARGGSNDLENMQGACHACHSHKTATKDSRFLKRKAE